MKKKFLDPSEFAEEVIETANKSGHGIIDALIDWCERRGLEVETVVPLVNKHQKLHELIQAEASALKLLK